MPNIWILSQEKSTYQLSHDACFWMRRPLGLHGGAAEKGSREPHTTLLVVLILPKDLSPASKVSRSLPCVLHLTLVQKCDLQVWELNVPLNSWINLSPAHMGTRWADLIVIWNGIRALKSVFPAGTKNDSLAFIRCYLRREFCHWCTRWLRGQEGRVWHGFPSEAVS